jgi:ABC-type multidrug transport system ATPase subunit
MTANSKTDIIFELKNVSVNYGFSKAIDNVSFELRRGQALGLIGANGAGKTTSIRALLGMLKVKSGVVNLLGRTGYSSSTFRQLGFAPEEATPPEYLTAKEYLEFLARLKSLDFVVARQQIADFLTWFELEPNKPVRKYSKGMRRRLILAQAFLGNPELIILDEPLNGLDPLMITKLRDKLKSYREQGSSILYSSHILSELENCCTDVVMMDHGSVVLKDSVTHLIQQYGSVEKAFSAKVGGQILC